MLGKKWEMNQSRTVVVVFYSLVGFMCYIVDENEEEDEENEAMNFASVEFL